MRAVESKTVKIEVLRVGWLITESGPEGASKSTVAGSLFELLSALSKELGLSAEDVRAWAEDELSQPA